MKIKEIILDAKEPAAYSESFIYEPTNVEEEKLGRLFMLGRIRNVPENSFYLINLLASRIKREYYKTSHKTQNDAIERALKEGNQVLKEIESRINWLGNLDFFAGSITENKIYFTLIGKMKSFILRQNEVVDLVRDLILEKDFLFPFSTIIQANLKKGDVLIFSTSNIFTKEKLIASGKDLFPLEEKNLKKFIDSQENGASLIVETGEIMAKVERFKPQALERKGFELKIPHPAILPGKISNFWDLFLKLGKKIKQRLSKVPSFFQKTKIETKEEIPRISVEKFSPSEAGWRKPQKLFSKQDLFILLFILFLVFSGFGIYTLQKNQKIKDIQKTVETAEMKKNEGENVLIYGDKEKALSLFEDSLNILNSIENPPSKEKSQIEELKNEIEANISEASGRKVISQLSPLFEIKKESGEANHFSLQNDKIYVSSSTSNQIYQWNISKKEGEFISAKGEGILAQAPVQEKMLFLLSPTTLFIEGGSKNIEFKTAYENQSVSEMDSFGNYFYILDNKEGEIIKYEIKGNEVSNPQLWFKERKIGKGAVSFAIDGSIYLAFLDGKIKRFSAGVIAEEIEPPKTYPQIKELTKIFTAKDNQYIYLLEAAEKRLVITNKKGEKTAEYQFPEFENLKDIFASPDDKNIYLLSDNKIYLILTTN